MNQREIIKAAYRFEEFCEKLFSNLGVNPTQPRKTAQDESYDFKFSSGMGQFFVVVKVRSSQRFSPREVDRIYSGAKHLIKSSRDFIIIIINIELSDDQFELLNSLHKNLIVVDANTLWRLSEYDEDVSRELQSTLSAIQPFSGRKHSDSRKHDELTSKIGLAVPNPIPPKAAPVSCAALKGIDPGKEHAKTFENEVTAALKYLFDGALTAWSEQERSDTGMSINDLVARNNSEIHFWRTLRENFGSLYILFEFKNYTKKSAKRKSTRLNAIFIDQHFAIPQ